MITQLIIIMGVSGSGKTTLAKKLAEQLCWHYMEADDYHTEDAKRMMAAGTPLTDDIREPWIQAMYDQLTRYSENNINTVLSYSGLKKKHRDVFRKLPAHLQIIHLAGDKHLIQQRMDSRKGHFMASHMLKSQFDALESTELETDVLHINIAQSTEQQLATIKKELNNNTTN